MKYYLIIFAAIFGFIKGISQNSFMITYSTSEDELLLSSVEDFAGNNIIVGRIGDRLTLNYDPLILKVYPNGNYEAIRIVKPDTSCYFKTINILQDSSYLVTGSFASGDDGNKDILWVCKYSSELILMDEMGYNNIDTSYYDSYEPTYSIIDIGNNIVLTGASCYGRFADLTLTKLNQNGELLLNRVHPFQFEQKFLNIATIPNSSDYLGIAGHINMHNYGPVRFDSLFNIISIKNFPSQMGHLGTSDVWINDTTYLYACIKYDESLDKMISLYSIDTSMNIGNSLDLNKLDTSDYPSWIKSMAYVNDSTIFVAGFINTLDFYPTNPNGIEVYLINSDLELLGYKEFGWDANYDVWSMNGTSDNGCLLYGNRRTPVNTTESDVYVLKVQRSDFEILTNITNLQKNIISKIWPNPTTDKLFIRLSEEGYHGGEIIIYDISGKSVTKQKLSGTGNLLEVNVSPLKQGYYIFKIHEYTKEYKGTFVKK